MNTRSGAAILVATAALAGIGVSNAVPAHAADGADLTVTTTPVTAAVGESVSITAALHNAGTGAADGARIQFVAPAGAIFDSESNGSCTLSSDKTQITCETDEPLAAGWQSNSTAILKVQSTAAYVTVGRVTISTDNDTNPSNNTAPIKVSNPDGGGIPGLGSSLPSGSNL